MLCLQALKARQGKHKIMEVCEKAAAEMPAGLRLPRQ